MLNYLNKKKNNKEIDFIKIGNKNFLLYSFKTNKFSEIFYDNKYREDTFNIDYFIKKLEVDIERLKGDIDTIGIYNTKELYEIVNKQLEFINKYNK